MSKKSVDNSDNFVEKVPMSAKLGFGAVNMGNGILSGIGLGSIDVFYLKVFGLDPILMGWSWILFMIWNAVNDPLLGIIEDKTKSKLGRRIPYLRFGALPYAIAFIIIWFPFITSSNFLLSFVQNWLPSIDSQDMGLFWNHLIILFVFDTLFSMIGLIGHNLPNEMAVSQKERTNILIVSGSLAAVGIAFPFISQMLLQGDEVNLFNLRIVMVFIGLFAGFLIFLGSYYVKENEYTQREETLGFLESIKACFKNKPFLIYEVFVFVTLFMQETLFSSITHFIDYLIQINGLISYLFAIPLVIIVLSAFIILNKRLEKYGLKKIVIISVWIAFIGFLITFVTGTLNNSKISIETSFIGLSFIFIGFIVFMFFTPALTGECVDYDETLTGKRREGAYSGINALLSKPAVSLAHFSFLSIITRFGYVKGLSVSEQVSSVSNGVLIAFTLIPAICLFIGGIAMKFFPLDGPEWKKEKEKLYRIHMKKEEEYIELLKREGKI